MDVRQSAKFISDNAKHVKMHGISNIANLIVREIKDGSFSQCEWQNQQDGTVHPVDKQINCIDWSFHSGYFSACACTNRAIDKGIPITDPKYYATISDKDLSKVFVDDNGSLMPMLVERKTNLHETGHILVQKFGGTFVKCIEAASWSAPKLLQLIVDSFPCYRDEAMYLGEKVKFYKRAQICISDVHQAMQAQGGEGLENIDVLTIFADYRVPQSLYYLGATTYSQHLLDLLKNHHVFKSGDPEEVEIRGLTVHVCEVLCQEVNKILKSGESSMKSLTPAEIDYWLWVYRRKHAEVIEKIIDFHRVRCIFY